MQIDLNLATNPFGQRRLFWLACGTAGLVLAISAALLVVEYSQNNEVSPEVARRQVALRAELAQLTQAETKARQALQDPANAPVLERSLFLNQLLYRKGISWTRLFGDLEEILPPRVLMTGIRPEVTPDNRVRLEMQVGAETPPDFIEFLQALQESELFGPATVEAQSPPNENQPLFRFQLSVNYEQQL